MLSDQETVPLAFQHFFKWTQNVLSIHVLDRTSHLICELKESNLAPMIHFCLFFACLVTYSPGGTSGKESICQCMRHKRCGFDLWVGKIPWRRKRQPLPVFLPEKSHGQRSLAGNSPWGFKKLDTTEQKHKEQVIYSKVVIERDGKGRKRRGQGR